MTALHVLTLRLHLANQETLAYSVTSGKIFQIAMAPKATVELIDAATGAAPPRVSLKKTGKDLLIQVTGSQGSDVEILLQNFEASDTQIFGISDAGHYVSYAACDPSEASIAQLSDSAPLVVWDGGWLFGGAVIALAGTTANTVIPPPVATPPVVTPPVISPDTLAPSLVITSDKTAVRAGETAMITFTFSEPISDFVWDGTAGDVIVSGGTLSAISGSGSTYTATFTPTANLATGTASITVAANSYGDAAGNAGAAASAPTITLDTVPPTVTISGDGSAGVITFNFSEAPANFTLASIVVSNGTAGTLTRVNPTQYTLTVTPAFAETASNIAVDVVAGAFTDAIGNPNALAENATTINSAYRSTSFVTDITKLDVSNVTNASNVFFTNTTFNQNIGGWDTHRVTTMANMFLDSQFNQDIGAWDTGQVTNMNGMLGGTPFNQNIGSWNTHNVKSMSGMFSTAIYFNQDIGHWDTGNVTSMSGMFTNAFAFNQDIGQWDTRLVTNMATMFLTASTFNQNIGSWETGHVTNMSNMFRNATAFDQDIGQWNIASLTTASNFLTNSGMSTDNVDKLLAGWSDVDTASGETALRSGVSLGLGTQTYTDATARQYLISTFGWTVDGTLLPGVVVGGNALNDTLNQSTVTTGKVMHGLGGADAMTGSAFADTLVGGAGNDVLTGGSGMDVFRYSFTNEGHDTLTDFTLGVGGDVLDIAHLLDGAKDGTIAQFVTLADAGGNVLKLNLDANGNNSGTDVSITFNGISYSAAHGLGDTTFLQQMIHDGNLLTRVL